MNADIKFVKKLMSSSLKGKQGDFVVGFMEIYGQQALYLSKKIYEILNIS